jgi:lysophospholipase L1-like esterase
MALLGGAWMYDDLGITGQTTAQMQARFAIGVTQPGDAEYVIIWGGINDIYNTNPSIDAPTIEANLQLMYTAAHTAGIKVVALTISPCKGYTTWTAPLQAVQDAVNTWITTTAINIDYKIDSYNVLVDPGNANQLLPAYDSGDHIHIATAGYTALANAIYAGVTWAYQSTTIYQLSLSQASQLNQKLRRSDNVIFQSVAGSCGFLLLNPTDGFTWGGNPVVLGGPRPLQYTYELEVLNSFTGQNGIYVLSYGGAGTNGITITSTGGGIQVQAGTGSHCLTIYSTDAATSAVFADAPVGVGFALETAGYSIFNNDWVNASPAVWVRNSGGSIDPSAVVQIDSIHQGFLPPRMTAAQRVGVSGYSGTAAADGLMVYDTDAHTPYYYQNGTWQYHGSGYSGISGYSGYSGKSGYSGISGYSGYSGISGYSGYSGRSGYSGASDIRIKRDIRPFKEGLSAVSQINPVYYKFNGMWVEAEQDFPNDGIEHVGIIAQELESILPAAIKKIPGTLYKGSEGDEMMTYDSVPIIMALVNAVKELEKRVIKLEKKGKR